VSGIGDEALLAELGLKEGFVDGDGARLHFVAAGTGPLVLFLHGFPAYWYSWRHQLPAVAAAGHRAVAVDLRGYHLSDRPPRRSAYAGHHLVADVAAVVDKLGGGRATVVGHDWGGAIAWGHAHAHPEQLERLVISNAPHPARLMAEVWRPPQLFRSWYILMLQLPWLPELLLTAGGGRVVGDIFRNGAAEPDAFTPDDLRRYREAFTEPGVARAAVAYYRNLHRSVSRPGAGPSGTIDVPVLVLWGERDKALDRRLLDGLERFAPRVEIRRYPDLGHFPHEERPAAFNEDLLRFVAGER
jgi:pimeloyl-ACP methyl ester carboxylesterase